MSSVHLTDRWISACRPPSSGRTSVVDAICPGLHLRVTTTGTKSFSVMMRVGGRLLRVTIGQYPAWSLSAARKEALRLQRDADQEAGAKGAAASASVASAAAEPGVGAALTPDITYDALVSSYADLHLQPNTRAGAKAQSIFRQNIMQPFLERPAASITRTELVAVTDALAKRTPHAAGNLLKALRAMFNWAVARDMVPANPCEKMLPPVQSEPRERTLTDAEIVKILRACDKVPSPFGDMVRVLLHTGARGTEVAEMRWRELDGNVWTLPAARAKNKRVNVRPLPPAVMAILAALPRYGGDDDYVFTTTHGRRPSSDFSKRKALLDAASGTSGWRLHDLRRTCRTLMSKLNVPRETARRILSHSVDRLDATYDQHDHREAKGAALVMVAEHLATLVGRPLR